MGRRNPSASPEHKGEARILAQATKTKSNNGSRSFVSACKGKAAGRLAGPEAGRIVTGALPMPGGATLPFTLAHALEDEGYLLCRYVRRDAG